MSQALRFRLLFAFNMSLLMCIMMTGWVSWINLGLVAGFASRWLYAFLNAWPPAFVIVLLLAPLMQKLTQKILARWDKPQPS